MRERIDGLQVRHTLKGGQALAMAVTAIVVLAAFLLQDDDGTLFFRDDELGRDQRALERLRDRRTVEGALPDHHQRRLPYFALPPWPVEIGGDAGADGLNGEAGGGAVQFGAAPYTPAQGLVYAGDAADETAVRAWVASLFQ